MKNKNKASSSNPASLEQDKSIDKLAFYGTVVLTGAAIMMVELLGTRVIGPFYGVSLVVWSSILAVTLLALAAGYHYGGKFADQQRGFRLPHALFLASVFIAVIPFVAKPVQVAFDHLGLRWGALSSAFVLFTPCLFFLGMACPYIVRMATKGIENVGSTAGNVYAISTFGSVAGTLMLGFYLLPMFGTYSILFTLSIIVLLLALALAAYERYRLGIKYSLKLWACTSVAGVGFLLFQLPAQSRVALGYAVVFEEESHYGWVRVVDQPEKNIRWLMSDASTIGAEHKSSGKGMLAYQQVVGLMPWFIEGAKDALLVGLGAGHLVNEFANFGVRTDAIEIDPAVANAAQRFFSFKSTGELMVGDARYSIKKIDKKYDLIVHDCFTGGAEPFHLLTKEMLHELSKLLKPGGVLAVNFLGFTEESKRKPVQSIARTLAEVFPQQRVLLAKPEERFNDYVFLASEAPLKISSRSGAEYIKAWFDMREIKLDQSKGEIITDNYNPLEFLQIAKAEYYRQVLVERVGASILFR